MPAHTLSSSAAQNWEELHQAADALSRVRSPILAEHGMSHILCMQEYGLRNIRLSQPVLVLVLEGIKGYARQNVGEQGSAALLAKASAPCLLLLPADTPLYLENIPDPKSSRYLAYCLRFDPSLVESVARYCPACSNTPQDTTQGMPAATLRVLPDENLLMQLRLLLRTTVEQLQDGPAFSRLLQLHCEQIALLLFLHGFGALMLTRHDALVGEAMRLIQQQPQAAWTLESLSQELPCSSRTLGRHLQKEGRSLRELLRHTRLHVALGMLQQQHCTVSEAAFACGYNSPSRFSRRFYEHFGLLPSELLRRG